MIIETLLIILTLFILGAIGVAIDKYRLEKRWAKQVRSLNDRD